MQLAPVPQPISRAAPPKGGLRWEHRAQTCGTAGAAGDDDDDDGSNGVGEGASAGDACAADPHDPGTRR